jgi:hypothetical protein
MTLQWGWIDTRTGQRVSVTSVPTREQAEATLARWVARDRRGGRPDLHGLIPYLAVVPMISNRAEEASDD